MSKLKDAVIELVDDVTSVEVAIVEKDSASSLKLELLSYSKIEFEGDAIHYFPTTEDERETKEVTELQITLNESSSRIRNAILSMAVAAIS